MQTATKGDLYIFELDPPGSGYSVFELDSALEDSFVFNAADYNFQHLEQAEMAVDFMMKFESDEFGNSHLSIGREELRKMFINKNVKGVFRKE